MTVVQLTDGFIVSSKTPGTDINFFGYSIYDKSGRLYIRQPAPFSMLFRVAYVMTEPDSFTTELTFSGQYQLPPFVKNKLTNVVKYNTTIARLFKGEL